LSANGSETKIEAAREVLAGHLSTSRLPLAGEAFAEAVSVVEELIHPIEGSDFVLEQLQEGRLTVSEPSASLALVNALVPERPRFWGQSLRNFLEQVRAARVDLEGTPAYRRLDRIAIERGL